MMKLKIMNDNLVIVKMIMNGYRINVLIITVYLMMKI